MITQAKEGSRDHGRFLLYSLSTCAHCRATRKLLADLGLSGCEVAVDQLTGAQRDEALAQMGGFNPALTFPTLVIGSKVIVGYLADDIRQAVKKITRAR